MRTPALDAIARDLRARDAEFPEKRWQRLQKMVGRARLSVKMERLFG
jgi:hypothetical protein